MTSIIIIIFVFALFLGTPLYVVLFSISAFLFSQTSKLPLISSVISFQKLDSQEFITAIPLFTFLSYVLSRSRSPLYIFQLFDALFSHIRGISPILVLILMAFFTALTGASGATILALGGLLYPLLLKNGKTESSALGLITSSGSIGLLIAPSLPVIMYSIIASQNMLSDNKPDINLLFKAGIFPSVCIIASFSLYSILKGNSGTTKAIPFNMSNIWKAVVDAKYEIPIPIIVYGGIYSGYITILEAAIISSFYVFFFTFFIRRDISLKELPALIVSSMKLSGSIFIIMATAFMFTNYVVDQQVPQKLFTIISPYIQSSLSFLFIINIVLLFVGFFIDIYSAILIVLPILIPLVERYQINPYHFAMIFLINLEIGYLTPPVGMNLFIAANYFKKPILTIYKNTVPFLIILLLNLLAITYIPSLSTFFLGDKNFELPKGIHDSTPPGVIDRVQVENVTHNSATLVFKAPLDNEGRVSAYIIHYSDFKMESEDDFDFSQSFDEPPVPQEPNSVERVTLKNLNEGTTYYVGIKSVDKHGNKSLTSPFVSFKTKGSKKKSGKF